MAMTSKTIIMTAAIAAVAVTLLGMTTVTEAQEVDGHINMTVTAQIDSYKMIVHGTAFNATEGYELTMTVVAPNNNRVTIEQVPVTNNAFVRTIATGGDLWSEDGYYRVYAEGANHHTVIVHVNIEDGRIARTNPYLNSTVASDDILNHDKRPLYYNEIEKKWQFWKDKSMDQKAEIKDLQKENKKLKKELEKVRNLKNDKKATIADISEENEMMKIFLENHWLRGSMSVFYPNEHPNEHPPDKAPYNNSLTNMMGFYELYADRYKKIQFVHDNNLDGQYLTIFVKENDCRDIQNPCIAVTADWPRNNNYIYMNSTDFVPYNHTIFAHERMYAEIQFTNYNETTVSSDNLIVVDDTNTLIKTTVSHTEHRQVDGTNTLIETTIETTTSVDLKPGTYTWHLRDWPHINGTLNVIEYRH